PTTQILSLDEQAHATGCAFHNSDGVIQVAGVQILQLLLGDVLHLARTDLEALVLPALLGLLFRIDQLAALLLLERNAGSLFEKHGSRRTLDNEVKAAVRINRYYYRDCDAAHLLRAIVKLRHEGPDIHAVLTQRRTHWP